MTPFDPPAQRLPFRFDVRRLKDDVRRLLEHQPWMPYFEFHAIALRALIPSGFGAPRWRRPYDYRLARLKFAAEHTSIPRALYAEGREMVRIVRHPGELSKRLAGWPVPPDRARTASARGNRHRISPQT